MKKEPYIRFQKEELILRDYLAVDRTALANERTFLSYTRTALAFALAGGSLLHFFNSLIADLSGGSLVALAGVTFGLGLQRLVWYRRRLEKLLYK